MTGTTPRVIVIPPKPELARSKAVQRQLRVAAYCRVSTDDEEQLTSYEAQFLYNYDVWQAAGGVFGTAPEFPDGNFFICVAAVFHWSYGLYGVIASDKM